jgi:fructan beta-fructosidase
MKGDFSTMHTTQTVSLRAVTAVALAGLALGSAMAGAIPAGADTTPGEEQYRPAIHFSPEKNWMNDLNGMVFYKGVYHL